MADAFRMLPGPGVASIRNFGEPTQTITPSEDVVVHLVTPPAVMTAESGATVTPGDDGGSVVDLNPQPKLPPGSDGWNENLALKLDDSTLSIIAQDLLQGIDVDIRSRTEWEQAYSRGLDLLGIKLNEPTSSPAQGTLAGISTINNPALIQAVINFQAGAMGELLPSDGPVKVKITSDDTGAEMEAAEDLETDLNHYLTTVDKDYYPDTIRGLFHVGFAGGVAKKVYWDPLLRRPVSRCVYLYDLIVSAEALSLQGAARVTHKTMMRTPVVRRLMKQGFWKDVALVTPTTPTPGPAQKEKQTQGIASITERSQDRDHTIYECYCDLDIQGYEHKDRDGPTGITLPWVVTLDKDSMKVLAIRRNWKEGDETLRPRRPFVLYPYILGLGFYPLGLVHILGNATKTLTAIDRECVDAGMFANFPGGAISDEASRQDTNELRSSPGGFKQIKTGGQPLANVLMPWPYKDITPGLMTLREKVMEETVKLGGSATIPIGEGNADIPVGTMLALIEQATKPVSAVHKLLHGAQAEEFQLLREQFREDPTALWREARDPARKWQTAAELENFDLVPVADPNVPTQMHRVMQVMALVQLATMFPGLLNPQQIIERALHVLGIRDTSTLVNDNPQPPQGQQQPQGGLLKAPNSPAQDAAAIMKAQADAARAQQQGVENQRKAATEAVNTQIRAKELESKAQDAAADRESKERIAAVGEETQRIKLAIEEQRSHRKDLMDAASLMQRQFGEQIPPSQ